jgi:ADP-ribosylglycohydrolase
VTENRLTDKIHGGLAAAIIGDAMGTATETMTRRRIIETYGRLETIVAPENSPFSGGRPAGHVSDDSSQMLLMCGQIVAAGDVRLDDVVAMLLNWSEDEDMFARNAGPTTREAVRRLRLGEDPATVGLGNVHTGSGLSNGAAMKAAPSGWINPGRVDEAAKAAAIIATPSHNTQVAIAGAAAVAGAVAMAMLSDASVDSVVEGALEGARMGEKLGLAQGREASGASVERRIIEAVAIARRSADIWEAMDPISTLIGSGLPANEAVPAALGMFVAARGDLRQTLIGAVNIGDDTDTVATIAGAIAGTFSGISSVPEDWYATVVEVNGLQLSPVAEGLAALAKSRLSR